ncbi:MAG TPA: 4'-phosphopantetheinyl transferase superfamily protein [Prolixibacteraceae bacterium]
MMYWERTSQLPKISSCQEILLVYGTFNPEDLESMSRILTPEELNFAGKLKHQDQRNTWISCHVTLRSMLGEFLEMDPQNIIFQKNRFGRSYLQDSNLFFNISHTNSSFLMGYNKGGKIGVDLENLSGDEDIPSLIDYAFSGAETEYCRNAVELSVRFLELWTLKEAFLKYSGIGLTDFLKPINVYGSELNELIYNKLNYSTFICPGNETGSVVYSNNPSLSCIWLC